jgi:hypothetical protein
MTVDFWAPMTIAYLYAFLIKAHPAFLAPYDLMRVAIRHSPAFTALLIKYTGGDESKLPAWVYGHESWAPRDATALCAIVLTVFFGLRAIYNFGGKSLSGGVPSPVSTAEKTKMRQALGLKASGTRQVLMLQMDVDGFVENEKQGVTSAPSTGVAWPARSSTPSKKIKKRA